MSKYTETAKVVCQEKLLDGIYSLVLETKDIAKEARPGQFVSLYTHDGSKLLPRPISICEVNGNTLRLVYRVVGFGTGEFSHYVQGDTVKIIGPLGNGFTIKDKKPVLVAGGSPEDLIKAMRLYRAIKKICKEEKLEALTLSCFKLIEQIDTTGCLALSLLNDDGIMAGCEGDLQSIFTLLAVKALTTKEGFMANPSMINTRTNELILAHCTVGLQQTERYIIRNHFETEKGIAIQGLLPTGDVTVIKCGGECLDEYYLSTGTLTENTNYINMCRTQVRIRMNTPAEYFLKNPLGNHHIMIHGNYEDTLNEFFMANACKRTE